MAQYDARKHPAEARALARQGLADDEIARTLHISIDTLESWREQYPAFGAALEG